MDLAESEHSTALEHSVSAPTTALAREAALTQFVEEHKLAKRLSNYPLVKTVSESTSGLYCKAKQMSPQVIADALDRAEATVVDAMQKQAPAGLASVEDFGCRQLDMLDNAMETPTGKSLQNLTSKIATVGKTLVDKTPLRSLTSSVDASSSPSESEITKVITEFRTKMAENGFKPTFLEYLVIVFTMFLTKAEDSMALPHDGSLENPSNAGKKKRSLKADAATENNPQLQDRTINVAAAATYTAMKKLDTATRDKISDNTRQRIGGTILTIQSMMIRLWTALLTIFLALPYIRDRQETINRNLDLVSNNLSDVSNKFSRALVQVERIDSTQNANKIDISELNEVAPTASVKDLNEKVHEDVHEETHVGESSKKANKKRGKK